MERRLLEGGVPQALYEKIASYLPPEKCAAVRSAFEFAAQCHAGQCRLSGGPYIEHPLSVTLTLAELQMDSQALMAALLHDVPEDCGVPLAEIEKRFGKEVMRLVDGVTKLTHIT